MNKTQDWEKEIKYIMNLYGTLNYSDERLIGKIHEVLAQHDQELVENLEQEKKSVKELFPDVEVSPTTEFANFVMMKDSYNRGISVAIELIKGKV